MPRVVRENGPEVTLLLERSTEPQTGAEQRGNGTAPAQEYVEIIRSLTGKLEESPAILDVLLTVVPADHPIQIPAGAYQPYFLRE